jgi:hypothetical protein
VASVHVQASTKERKSPEVYSLLSNLLAAVRATVWVRQTFPAVGVAEFRSFEARMTRVWKNGDGSSSDKRNAHQAGASGILPGPDVERILMWKNALAWECNTDVDSVKCPNSAKYSRRNSGAVPLFQFKRVKKRLTSSDNPSFNVLAMLRALKYRNIEESCGVSIFQIK